MSSANSIADQDYQTTWGEIQEAEDFKKLPMRVRLGLRDKYFKEEEEVQKLIDEVSKDLGVDIHVHVSWPKIWAGLSSEFTDAAKFVPAISQTVKCFLHAVSGCCNADDAWGDKLLENMKKRGKKILDLYVIENTSLVSMRAQYLPHNASILLQLPKTAPSSYLNLHRDRVIALLQPMFAEAEEDNDWENTEVDDVKVPASGSANIVPVVRKLPNVNDLPKPEIVMDQSLPYWITITVSGGVEINCSHPRTLTLIESYVEARSKRHPYDKERSWTRVERYAGWMGEGGTSQVLRIESTNQRGEGASPMPIIALLQHSLGYEVHHTDGHTWVLRRDIKFH